MSKRQIVLAACLGASLAVLAGCTRGSEPGGDPNNRLRDYISKSFAVRTADDRKDLMDFLTGDAKLRLTAWSDEQFRQAFIESKRQFIKFAVRETKQASQNEVNITYELTYLDQGKGHDAKVTNKKLCLMVLENGKWLISDVRNIKELVEYRNEMSLP